MLRNIILKFILFHFIALTVFSQQPLTMVSGSDCPGEITGFTSLGAFGNSNYYISNQVSTPVNAQLVAANNNGYLAVINSQTENDFLQQNISEMVYIGLNDSNTEGVLEWQNGEAVDFTNFEICSFCNENNDDLDFTVIHPWNGTWSWSSHWAQRRFIIEIPCGNVDGVDLALEMAFADTIVVVGDEIIATLSVTNNGLEDATNIKIHSWRIEPLEFVSATPTLGNYTYDYYLLYKWEIPLLKQGESETVRITYRAGNTLMNTYSAGAFILELNQIDVNSNNDNVLVSVEKREAGGCPLAISGFTNLGEFGDYQYYLSNEVATPIAAQIIAESHAGNLVVINSQAENDFVQQHISEMVYIGLNDFAEESNLKWVNGDRVGFTNFAICNFCNENDDDMDFALIHPWNGGWSWSSHWAQRRFVMEVSCTVPSSLDNGNSLIAITNTPVKSSSTKVFPNPADHKIYISIRSDEAKTTAVQIVDSNGQLRKLENLALHKGENTLEINISDLAAGMYFLMIPENGGQRRSERFVKMLN